MQGQENKIKVESLRVRFGVRGHEFKYVITSPAFHSDHYWPEFSLDQEIKNEMGLEWFLTNRGAQLELVTSRHLHCNPSAHEFAMKVINSFVEADEVNFIGEETSLTCQCRGVNASADHTERSDVTLACTRNQMNRKMNNLQKQSV